MLRSIFRVPFDRFGSIQKRGERFLRLFVSRAVPLLREREAQAIIDEQPSLKGNLLKAVFKRKMAVTILPGVFAQERRGSRNCIIEQLDQLVAEAERRVDVVMNPRRDMKGGGSSPAGGERSPRLAEDEDRAIRTSIDPPQRKDSAGEIKKIACSIGERLG